MSSEDKAYGVKKIASPKGVIAAITPTTNPTSTTIYKIMLALKTATPSFSLLIPMR